MDTGVGLRDIFPHMKTKRKTTIDVKHGRGNRLATRRRPKPPFSEPRQKMPGLVAKMRTQPDHGEHTYRGLGRLTGKTALITGGDSGIGRAVAIAFAREGADVAISYLEEEEEDAKETRKWIEGAGRKSFSFPGDIQDENYCQRAVEKLFTEQGRLDILVNNAAFQEVY